MNSPEDESPLPSEGVLSEEETSRQLRADSVRQYTERIKQLENKLSETEKGYTAIKDWAHKVEAHLETLLDHCCDHADGAPDATPLAKFCNEMIGISNSVMLKDIQTLRAERDKFKSESEIVRRVLGLPDNIALEASLTAYRDDYAALKQLHAARAADLSEFP